MISIWILVARYVYMHRPLEFCITIKLIINIKKMLFVAIERIYAGLHNYKLHIDRKF